MSVILEVPVPDAAVTQVMGAFTTIVDTHMTLSARGSRDPEAADPEFEFSGKWDFRIDPQEAGENDKQFGERVLRSLGLAVVKMVDLSEDTIRHADAVAAVDPPASDVSDDVLG